MKRHERARRLTERVAAAGVSIGILLSLPHSLAAADATWLEYEPKVVELSGKIMEQLEYGPPYYGEHPETDEKVHAQILKLAAPVSVRAKPDDDMNNETIEGIREIQLAFGSIRHDYLTGKCVVLRGSLYHAYSAYHVTQVLMRVTSVRVVGCR